MIVIPNDSDPLPNFMVTVLKQYRRVGNKLGNAWKCDNQTHLTSCIEIQHHQMCTCFFRKDWIKFTIFIWGKFLVGNFLYPKNLDVGLKPETADRVIHKNLIRNLSLKRLKVSS